VVEFFVGTIRVVLNAFDLPVTILVNVASTHSKEPILIYIDIVAGCRFTVFLIL
jgi:hypothetical protein